MLKILAKPINYRALKPFSSKIPGAKCFAKTGRSNAYSQMALDEKSQELSTVKTTRQLFLVTLQQQTLKKSAAIFQQVDKEIFKKVTGCVAD